MLQLLDLGSLLLLLPLVSLPLGNKLVALLLPLVALLQQVVALLQKLGDLLLLLVDLLLLLGDQQPQAADLPLVITWCCCWCGDIYCLTSVNDQF